jgi:hypothetical protein
MSYGERTAKLKAGLTSKWASQPRGETPDKISEQRRELWQALNDFVMERGGAIVSPKFHFPIRLEVTPDSELPAKLRELGYDLIFRNEETRIGAPVSEPGRWGRPRYLNTGYSFRGVAVYELDLPR